MRILTPPRRDFDLSAALGTHQPLWRILTLLFFKGGNTNDQVGYNMTAESLLSRITVESGKCGGRPCIRGLRIRVQDVLGMLAEGMANNEILEDYPYLEQADIRAVLMYAARQFDHPVLQAA